MSQAITDGQRANWGVAWASQTRTKQLGPALKRAYSVEPFGVPDGDALAEAKRLARSIHRALVQAEKLLNSVSSVVVAPDLRDEEKEKR